MDDETRSFTCSLTFYYLFFSIILILAHWSWLFSSITYVSMSKPSSNQQAITKSSSYCVHSSSNLLSCAFGYNTYILYRSPMQTDPVFLSEKNIHLIPSQCHAYPHVKHIPSTTFQHSNHIVFIFQFMLTLYYC